VEDELLQMGTIKERRVTIMLKWRGKVGSERKMALWTEKDVRIEMKASPRIGRKAETSRRG
jgi:hypothetical protein